MIVHVPITSWGINKDIIQKIKEANDDESKAVIKKVDRLSWWANVLGYFKNLILAFGVLIPLILVVIPSAIKYGWERDVITWAVVSLVAFVIVIILAIVSFGLKEAVRGIVANYIAKHKN